MKKRYLFFLCILSFFSLSLYAKDENDLSLFEIDKLIRQTDYEEALRLLNIYINKYPDNFDNAQRRIKRIMNIRKQYSILAEKLINLILTEPENDKEIYEITAQLERFEKNPSDEHLQFIADLKKSAEFNYFRSQFNEVQTQSAGYTQSGLYSDSIAIIRQNGFWLYKDSFYERWENNPEITAKAQSVVDHLEKEVANFNDKNFNNRFNKAVNDYVNSLNNDKYDDSVKNFNTVLQVFQEYAALRNSIFEDAHQLEVLFEEVQKLDQDSTDASYLPFMFRFIYGVSYIPDSGIIGAVDGQWKAAMTRMNTALFANILKYYERYRTNCANTAFTAKQKIDNNAANTNRIKNYSLLEQNTLNLYNFLNVRSGQTFVHPFSEYFVYTDYLNALTLAVSGLYNNEIEINDTKNLTYQTIDELKNKGQDKNFEEKLMQAASKIILILGNKDDKGLEKINHYAAYAESKNESFKGLEEEYTKEIDSLFKSSEDFFDLIWKEESEYFAQKAKALADEVVLINDSGQTFYKGFNSKLDSASKNKFTKDTEAALSYKDNSDASGNLLLLYSYPEIALNISLYGQKKINSAIKEITDYKARIKNNYDAESLWQEDEEISSYYEECRKELDSQILRLEELMKKSDELVQNSRQKIISSQIARNEGDTRYSEAQTALKNQNFSLARRKLEQALSKYEEALTISDDESLRREWDSKLAALGENINRTENEIIVKEVRLLKTQAREAYFNGFFDEAEKYLNQAKNRWAITNAVEDEEITSLMNYINTAISMQTGRDISPSAPQYPEMSQLINIANQYYEEGQQYYRKGDKEQGNLALQKALDNIRKVQVVYPLNAEASLLTLKINKLMNPSKFEEEFAQKIKIAQNMCKDSATVQEGYSTLLDYYKINPDYKGLKDLIYKVEIDIGIRQKPVDNSALTRSKNLYNDAQKTYNNAGNNLEKLQSALEKVNRALVLNPNNTQAQGLKDTIITKMGGTATQISMEDEQLYNQAIVYLQNNNVIAANQILKQLLNKPQNQYVQKIKDLKAKIEARM